MIGGANSAGQGAMRLSKHCETVYVVIRSESLSHGMSDYLVKQIESTPNIEVLTSSTVAGRWYSNDAGFIVGRPRRRGAAPARG